MAKKARMSLYGISITERNGRKEKHTRTPDNTTKKGHVKKCKKQQQTFSAIDVTKI